MNKYQPLEYDNEKWNTSKIETLTLKLLLRTVLLLVYPSWRNLQELALAMLVHRFFMPPLHYLIQQIEQKEELNIAPNIG